MTSCLLCLRWQARQFQNCESSACHKNERRQVLQRLFGIEPLRSLSWRGIYHPSLLHKRTMHTHMHTLTSSANSQNNHLHWIGYISKEKQAYKLKDDRPVFNASLEGVRMRLSTRSSTDYPHFHCSLFVNTSIAWVLPSRSIIKWQRK